MSFARMISQTAVALACVGLVLPPTGWANAAQPTIPRNQPPVRDLALGENNILSGQVVNSENVPLANQMVLVIGQPRQVVKTTTDANGRFAITGLRGGTYAVGTPNTFAMYRVWTNATAPPLAQRAVLLVETTQIIRGQHRRAWYWLTDPYFLAAAVGVGLAVAIAADNRKPPGS